MKINMTYPPSVKWAEVQQDLTRRVRALPHGRKGDLAGHLKVSPAYLSQILAGTRPMPIERAEAIAEFLGIELDHQIVEGQGE